jgi:hypothetical protein
MWVATASGSTENRDDSAGKRESSFLRNCRSPRYALLFRTFVRIIFVLEAVRAFASSRRNRTSRQRSLKEILMKTVLLVAGGLLYTCAWHVNAQATSTNSTTEAQTSADNSEGPDASANSMSGAPARLHGKTREEVYQDLVRSQKNGEAARLQELLKGS